MLQDIRYLIRQAKLEDVHILNEVIAESARALTCEDYTEAQIEAALGGTWGVDTELIRDGTYFVVETHQREIVACGGWSRRRTLFGGDKQPGRQSELLDPGRESARVRAFFVRPNWARKGIGRALLVRCEGEALAQGFCSVELMATLTGERLYAACGYAGNDRLDYSLGNGVSIQFIPMSKRLV